MLLPPKGTCVGSSQGPVPNPSSALSDLLKLPLNTLHPQGEDTFQRTAHLKPCNTQPDRGKLRRAVSAELPTPNIQIHSTWSSDLSIGHTKVDVVNHQALETTVSAWMWHINSFTGNHMRPSGRLLKPGSTAVFQEI